MDDRKNALLGSPEAFLTASVLCIALGCFANWHGTVPLITGLVLTISGFIVNIFRWKNLSFRSKLVTCLLIAVCALWVFLFVPAF